MDILVLFCDLSLFYSIHLRQNNFLHNDLLVVRYEIEKAFPYEFPSINNYYHQCLSPNLFRPDQFYLSDFPRKVVLSYTEIFLEAMGLVAGNEPLRHHKTVLRNRYNRSVGIADVVFPYRRRCNDYPMSACRVVPTPCRRDSNRSVRSPNRRRRRPAARCPDDPSGNCVLPTSCRCSCRRSSRR